MSATYYLVIPAILVAAGFGIKLFSQWVAKIHDKWDNESKRFINAKFYNFMADPLLRSKVFDRVSPKAMEIAMVIIENMAKPERSKYRARNFVSQGNVMPYDYCPLSLPLNDACDLVERMFFATYGKSVTLKDKKVIDNHFKIIIIPASKFLEFHHRREKGIAWSKEDSAITFQEIHDTTCHVAVEFTLYTPAFLGMATVTQMLK